MTKDNKIIEASNKFRPDQAEARREASAQLRKDGAQIIRKLNCSGFKVPQQEREKVARNIGQLVHENDIKRQILALEADMDSKEIYRLTLQRHEESPSDKNRLRAKGKQYLSVITAIAKIAKLDRADLASRVTYGTSIHPSSSPASSEIEWLMQGIYDLVDGIEEEFNLLNLFKALSQMKAVCEKDEPFAFWPSLLPDGKWESPLPVEEIDQASFWSKTYVEQEISDQLMEFTNLDWPHVIGFLPHYYLGLSDNFDFDADYWIVPNDVTEEINQNTPGELYFSHSVFGEEKEEFPKLYAWRRKIRERLEEYIGDVSMISVAWDSVSNQLMFSGKPAAEHQKALLHYSNDIYMVSGMTYEDDHYGCHGCHGSDYSNSDSISHYWIGVFPNKALTGMVPVFISTNDRYDRQNSIEIITSNTLEKLSGIKLIGGETVGSKIRRSLEISQLDEEPMLKAEWRRTALFIEHHPLLMKQKKMKKTEDHIRIWREGIHKS